MLTMHWTKDSDGRLRMQWRVQENPAEQARPASMPHRETIAAPEPVSQTGPRVPAARPRTVATRPAPLAIP